MEIYAEIAMSILDELHTERRAYHSEYVLLADAINRLAAYEETGLEPEAVEHLKLASMGKAIAEIKEFEGVPIDRLRELAQADREGRVKIDPKALKCPKCGKMRLFPRIDWQYYYCYSCKTQFPREAAEAALKEREAEHDR